MSMRARTLLAAALTALGLAAAGCGGSSATPGGAPGGAAAVAPADAAAFVAVDTDVGSSQWRAVDSLLRKLPQHDSLLAQLRSAFEQRSGLSWENEVKPALGPELDLVVLPAAREGSPQVVALLQPRDRSKLDALLGKLGGSKPATADVGGWTALSESAAALTAVSGATQHLADSSIYQEATGRLAPDALVSVFANGAEAQKLVSSLGVSLPAGQTGQLVWAAADALATGDGLRLDGYLRREGGAETQPYASKLLDRIPSGALAVADFQAGSLPASGTTSTTPLAQSLQKLGGTLGGETALVVTPGTPLPAVTLVTHAADPQAVLDSLHSLLAAGAAAPQTGSLGLGGLLGGLQLTHRIVDGDLVVSTSQQVVDAFAGGGAKLAADDAFRAARSAAGMPDETTGFLYVDLADALPALQGLATLAGAPATGGDLGALRSLTAYGSGADGGVSRFTAFLEVR